jgi:hypothetical protein
VVTFPVVVFAGFLLGARDESSFPRVSGGGLRIIGIAAQLFPAHLP